MHTTLYLILIFGVLTVVGFVGEVTGFRALVCGRRRDDTFVMKLVLTIGMYVVVSWIMVFFVTHLLEIRFTGGW